MADDNFKHEIEQSVSNPDEPASLGTSPVFDQALHVGRPNIGNREEFLDSVSELLDRNWLTNDGPLVREFEKAVIRDAIDKVGGDRQLAARELGIGLSTLYRKLEQLRE